MHWKGCWVENCNNGLAWTSQGDGGGGSGGGDGGRHVRVVDTHRHGIYQ